MPQIRTALLSAYAKEGLDERARILATRNIAIWASGGTTRYLTESGISVQSIEQLTGFSDLLGGRVKTLHPSIFSAILARATESDLKQLQDAGFPQFDLVFVDLYPFSDALSRGETDRQKLIELIDIGGVALLRAAAKNHQRVIVCHKHEQLDTVIEAMNDEGTVSDELARKLACETMFFTAVYDSTIANWLWDGEDFTDCFATGGNNAGMPVLRYGENPHQKAAVYYSMPIQGVPSAEVLSGKALSYNNFLDLDAAYWGAVEFDKPSCTIVKHLSPCGIAIGENLSDAYTKALASDPLSAFGGIVAVNRTVEADAAEKMRKHFFECILAPDFSDEAIEILTRKKNLRLLKIEDMKNRPRFMARGIAGGILLQELNPPGTFSAKWDVVSERKPSDDEEMQLCFAMRATKLVKSNTVLIARDGATIGIGGGLPSRVDAAILAVRKAGDRANGAVAASDAFMPFPDTLYVLAEAGVTAVVQPGGSKNDSLAIEAADKLGVAMVFTGMRHFRH